MDEKIVMDSSDEAAKPHTMAGWLSSNGRFYADERTARYDGCTHRPCNDCGEPAKKLYTLCKECGQKAELARFNSRPKQPWDGISMLYSDSWDRYFADPDEAEEFADDEGTTMEELRLVLCEPNYVRPLEADYCVDELAPDDEGEIPDKVDVAMRAFNEAVDGIILSWSPGKAALDLSTLQDRQV